MDSHSGGMLSSVNPMLVQHVLRGLCSYDSQWVYAVFWRILPRNYPPPRWDVEGSVMDRSKGNRRNWILVWEDGFCNFSACARHSRSTFFSVPHLGASSSSNENSQQQFPELALSPELFFKMSHDAYNFGEGVIGKVALDKSHKWIYPEPLENETGYFTTLDNNLDLQPRTWEGQFKAGIQTIAVIAVDEGVLQLGSTQKIMEDLNFVLYIQRKFNFLHTVPGLLVPHPTTTTSSSEGRRPPPDCVSTLTASVLGSDVAAAGSSDQFLFTMKTPDPESTTTSELVNWSQHSFHYSCDPDPAPETQLLMNGLLTIPPHAFMPSMASSLEALLSKLPDVTVPLEDNNIRYDFPSNMGNAYGNVEVSPNSGGFNDFNVSSDGSDLQRLVDGEGTAYSSVGNSAGEDGEFESPIFVAYENFPEFGIQEALQDGDSSFSSFLNETCS